MLSIASILIPVLLIGLVILIISQGYFKAPPDTAYIVSGIKKEPRIYIGKAGVRIPFFERIDKLALGTIPIDVKTSSAVPTNDFINIHVDATAIVRIDPKEDMMRIASENFLNCSREDIAEKVNDLLEANLREIVGGISLVEMVNDRKSFSEKVQANAVPDLANLGLDLISFNVQNFADDNDVIENLGIDNVEQIRKKAAIAKSDAQREIAIAEAENAKQANDAKVKAAEDIAIRNNDLAIKEAQLKRESDTQKAQADAAMDIEAENQKKLKNIAGTDAEIAKAEREAELKQKEIELKEYELTALVCKQADAEKYNIEKQAEAELTRKQREAEAKRYEQEQKAAAERYAAEQEAEAMRTKADAAKYAALAEAEGIAAKGKAEAEAIQAKALAEAEGIDKKAEAQKKMETASILEMYFNALPAVVSGAAAPLANVDKITMYGDGNQTKMMADVMKSTDQIMNALAESTGIDVKSVLAGFVGGKAAQ